MTAIVNLRVQSQRWHGEHFAIVRHSYHRGRTARILRRSVSDVPRQRPFGFAGLEFPGCVLHSAVAADGLFDRPVRQALPAQARAAIHSGFFGRGVVLRRRNPALGSRSLIVAPPEIQRPMNYVQVT